MSTAILERETNDYWEIIKNVSAEVKLALISRLSNSLIKEHIREDSSVSALINDIEKDAPIDCPLTNEDIMKEIKAVRYSS